MGRAKNAAVPRFTWQIMWANLEGYGGVRVRVRVRVGDGVGQGVWSPE